MGKIKEGFLLGVGIFIAINVMGMISTLALYTISLVIRTFMTSGIML